MGLTLQDGSVLITPVQITQHLYLSTRELSSKYGDDRQLLPWEIGFQIFLRAEFAVCTQGVALVAMQGLPFNKIAHHLFEAVPDTCTSPDTV